jgi:sugar lactone lactonase YvrE
MTCVRRLVVVVCAFTLTSVVAHAHEGWGIVVQRDGTIYVADIPTNTIWRIRPDGALDVAAADKHSHALAEGSDGSIYGTHEHVPLGRTGEVWKIDREGRVSIVVAADRSFPLSLHPFAIDDWGAMYSTTLYAGATSPQSLMRRNPDGQFVTVAESARFEGIDGIAVAPDGSLYLSDGADLRRITPDGIVSTIAASITEPSWGEDLMGLTRRDNGEIYVADYSGARVLRVRAQVSVDTVLEAAWPWAPTGVAFRDNDLFVIEHLRMPLVILGNLHAGPYMRVRHLDARGSVRTIKTIWGDYTLVAAAVLIVPVIAIVLVIRRFRHSSATRDRRPGR